MATVKGIYFCAQSSLDAVYGPEQLAAIARRLDIPNTLVVRENWREHRALLEDAGAIVSSWGGAILDEELLAAMPNLKIYFYGAGSIQGLMINSAWNRGIRITSAAAVNAIPVAEFVLAQTIFSLKRGWEYMQLAKADLPHVWQGDKPVQGMFGSKVGLVGFGVIARKIAELLRPFDVEVYASSLSPEEESGVAFVSTEEIFKTCDVVSLHLPSNEGTKGIIGRKLLDTMKPNSTLINTARGAIIDQPGLIEFLKARPDVFACIDVTEPEPPELGCPFFGLPNVVLTPHLAGSFGNERRRLGHFIVDEIDRYLAGQPLKGEITCEEAATLA
ncbi:MAG: hydroxyacid dehydrogenase [Verrucomicrobiota bacterium]